MATARASEISHINRFRLTKQALFNPPARYGMIVDITLNSLRYTLQQNKHIIRQSSAKSGHSEPQMTCTVRVNNTCTEHRQCRDLSGSVLTFISSSMGLPLTMVTLITGLMRGTDVVMVPQSPGCSGHVRLTANQSSMQLQ